MDKKKLAAIMTAVNSYIKVEPAAAEANLVPSLPTMWGTDGRRQLMSMRTLWQLRIFRRAV